MWENMIQLHVRVSAFDTPDARRGEFFWKFNVFHRFVENQARAG